METATASIPQKETGVDGFLLKAGTDPAARDYTLVTQPHQYVAFGQRPYA